MPIETRDFADFISAPGIAPDFEPDYEKLQFEVKNHIPAFTSVLLSIPTPFDMNAPAKVGFNFSIALTGPENTELDTIVANHDGLQIDHGITAKIFTRLVDPTTSDNLAKSEQYRDGYYWINALFTGAPRLFQKVEEIAGAAQWVRVTLVPSLNAARTYIRGFQVNEGTTASKVTVFDGSCTALSGSDVIESASNMVLDTLIVGAGGMDAGTVSLNKLYIVYVIAKDDGTTNVLASLKSDYITTDSPTMPAEYTKRRRVGSFRTSSFSTTIIQQMTEGDGNKVHVEYGGNRTQSPFKVVPGGSQSTFTVFDLNSLVPPSAPNVQVVVNNKNSPSVYLRSRLESTPLNSTFGNRAVGGEQRGNFQMPVWRSKTTYTRELEYAMSSGSGGNVDIAIMGFEDLR